MKKSLSIILFSLFVFSCIEIDAIKNEPKVKIETIAPSEIFAVSSVVIGNIIDVGGTSITQQGGCYNTAPGPTISNKTIYLNLIMTGKYPIPLNNLNPKTKYFCRAFCVNSKGITYGNEISFTTPDFSLPSFTSIPTIVSVSNNSISVKGIFNDGGGGISEYGFCYSENSNPTIDNFKVQGAGYQGPKTALSIAETFIKNLKSNSGYYIRAFATNSKGTAYSDQVLIKTTL
jgi:hypothetical protein